MQTKTTAPHRGRVAHGNLEYRPDIDGLRAIAVLLVLFFHFDLLEAAGGFLGVDVFFVISGYLITSILIRGMDDQTFRLSDFYIRRIRRLVPALAATLLLTLAFGFFLLLPDEFQELTRQLVASQFYVANFYYWMNVDYFGLQAEGVYLLHTWSLAVEEQFYLFYPLFLLVIHRHFPRQFWQILVASLLASLLLCLWISTVDPQSAFYMLPTRAWQLLAGAVCVPLVREVHSRPYFAQVLGVTGIALITGSVAFYNESMAVPGIIAILPVAGAAGVILAGTAGDNITRHALSLRSMVHIGKISYPLYLVHWPISVFGTMLLAENYTLSVRWVLFFCSVAVAELVFRYIEKPVREGLTRRTYQATAGVYALLLITTLLLFLSSTATEGFPARFSDDVLEISEFALDRTPSDDECAFSTNSPLDEQYCRLGRADSDPVWLVFGDSHAWAARQIFDSWLTERNQAGLMIFRHSCLPLEGVSLQGDGGVCEAFTTSVINHLQTQGSIENVLIVSTWHQPLEGLMTDNTRSLLDSEQAIQLFHKAFTSTLERINAMEKKVYVWEPVPGARQNVPHTMARALVMGRDLDLSIPLSEYLETYDFLFEAMARNDTNIEQRYAPSLLLCDALRCKPTIGGKPAYFDNSHLASSHAQIWARLMRKIDERNTPMSNGSSMQEIR